MAKKYFTDWDKLTNAINQKCKEILTEYVAPISNELLRNHIVHDIYFGYTPKQNGWVGGSTYARRGMLSEWVTSFTEDSNTLVTTSTASPAPSVVKGWRFENRQTGSFLELLESDNLGVWRGGFPRPAVSNTEKEYDTGTAVKSAISKGINKEFGDCTLI